MTAALLVVGGDRNAAPGARALLLFGVVLIVCAYIIGFGWRWDHLRPFLKDLLFAIATAVLVTWGLTRLMEIPHVADYVAGKLADLMFGDQYLNSIRSSLPGIRRRIDRVLYGEAALGYPWSLYNFVNDQVHEFYRASFRRNYTVQVVCRREPGDASVVRWRESTGYIYVRNAQDDQAAKIPLFHEWTLPAAQSGHLSEEEKRALFNKMVTRLELHVGDVILKNAEGDRTKLVRTEGSAGPAEVDIKLTVEDHTVRFDLEYTVPPEILARKEIRVDILEEYLDPAQDNVYYLGVLAPTEDFTLVCDFPEDVRLELLRFSMKDPMVEPPIGRIPSKGHGMVTIDGWLLPGHGGCVAWYGLEKDSTSQPPPKEEAKI